MAGKNLPKWWESPFMVNSGFTGDGPPNMKAGTISGGTPVHKEEFVLNQRDVNAAGGHETLESLVQKLQSGQINGDDIQEMMDGQQRTGLQAGGSNIVTAGRHSRLREGAVDPQTIPGKDPSVNQVLTTPAARLDAPSFMLQPEAQVQNLPANLGQDVGDQGQRQVLTTPAPRPDAPGFSFPTTTLAGAGDTTGDRETFLRNIGTGGLTDIARGQSPVFQTLSNLLQSQIAGRGAAGQEAARQEALQTGAGTGETRAILGQEARKTGAELAAAGAETALGAQKEAARATETLAREGLAGQRLAEEKRKFDIGEKWNKFNAANIAQDYQGMSDAYFDITGQKLDTSKMQQIWDQANTDRTFKVQNDAFLDAMRRGDETGNYTEAIAAWDKLASNPDYAGLLGAEPVWDSLKDKWQDDNLADMNLRAGARIGDGASVAEVENDIIEILETSSGKSMDELLQDFIDEGDLAEGSTVDDLIKFKYNEIAEASMEGAEKLRTDMEQAYGEFMDTPEESTAFNRWFSDMLYGNYYTLDAEGNIIPDTSKIPFPWDNPATEHIFNPDLTTDADVLISQLDPDGSRGLTADDPGIAMQIFRNKLIVTGREAYVDRNKGRDEPLLSFSDWQKAQSDSFAAWEAGEREVDGVKYDDPMDFAVAYVDNYEGDGKPTKTVITTEGEKGIAENTSSPTGFVIESGEQVGMPVKETASGEFDIYDYAAYKKDQGGQIGDTATVEYYASLGDGSAAQDYIFILESLSDPIGGLDLSAGDTIYKTMLSVAPAGPISYIKENRHKIVNRNGVLYFVGGTGAERDPDRDVTYLYDISTKTWKKLSHESQKFVS